MKQITRYRRDTTVNFLSPTIDVYYFIKIIREEIIIFILSLS